MRILPLTLRAMRKPIPFINSFGDIFLISLMLSDLFYYRTDKDPADCNNTFITLLTCSKVQPTVLSKWVWNTWRKYGAFEARLRRYHRAESGGNPEIAEWLIEAASK
jgi:hypothetical protein